MNFLVTGGAGFIGSNFLRHMTMNYPNDRFINVDVLTYAGNLENLDSLKEATNYMFYKLDICDTEALDNVFRNEQISSVVNFAAETHVDRSINNPITFVETNVLGTMVLLNLSRKYEVERFIQVSTDEVYGSLGNYGCFTEETPLRPNSPYAASKASADFLVRAAIETYGLNASITRCSNNYGPYQFPEKLIPLMIWNALDNKPLPVYGDGLNVRDWLYVKDHCHAVDLVLRQGKKGEVYNIGGSNERTNLEIVRMILDILGKSEDLILHVEDRLGHDRRYAIDASKIKQDLGWAPLFQLEDGIRSTVDWYLNNEDWWRKILSGEYLEYYEKMYRLK